MKKLPLIWIVVASFLTSLPALAAPSLALYEGADRTERLLAGAKREGSLTLYTSMNQPDTQKLVSAFEQKYGVKVSVWRSGKNKVLERALSEARAGRYEADVLQNPAPEMEAAHREKLLQRVKSPHHDNLMPAALPAHGEWAGMRTYVFVAAYNSNKVGKDELPRTYEDLLDPKWKGRLGIEGKAQDWFYAIASRRGEAKTAKLFRDIATSNGFSVRMGNSLLTNLVVSGEVPLALGLYSYLVEQRKREGAPIDYVALSPTVAFTDGVGVARNSRRPHAALLFYDFALTEGQAMMAEGHHFTTTRAEEKRIAAFNPIYLDPVGVLQDYDKWLKLFTDTVTAR